MSGESIVKFAFKIESKPEGGFIARSDALGVTFEGATKEEVEEKIRAKALEVAGPEVAELLKKAFANPGMPVPHTVKKFELVLDKTSKNTPIAITVGQPTLPAQGGTLGSGPIERTEENTGLRFLKLLLVAGAVALVIWLLVYRR